MARTNLYVVRRCDNFYRFWSDVTDPVPMAAAKSALDRLTDGGAHSVSPDEHEFFDIFLAASEPCPTLGTPPLIRRLRRHDAALLEEHFLSLDREDRRLRFFNEMSDEQLRRYVRNIDWEQSIILGAIIEDQIIGISEALFDHALSPQHAEITVTVNQSLRGRGLARCLIDQVIDYASAHGALRVRLYFLYGNHPLQRLVRSLGGSLRICSSNKDHLIGELPVRRQIPLAAAA